MRLKLERIADIAVLVTSVTILIFMSVQLHRSRISQSPTAQVEDIASRHVLISTKGSVTAGSPTASLAVIEFSDFQCPFCGRYARDVYPQVRKRFLDAGKVKYVFRNLPLSSHLLARGAAVAAQCAGEQNLFWEMHERLFSNQQALEAADLIAHAVAVGVEPTTFNVCFKGAVPAKIDADLREADRLGIKGTPTFMIGDVDANGDVRVRSRINGAQSFQVFATVIEGLLGSAEAGKPSVSAFALQPWSMAVG
jgi:protein-disulfide isomerase